MPCGKDHSDKGQKIDEDLKKQEDWSKKNPGCSPTIDKECPHGHDAPER